MEHIISIYLGESYGELYDYDITIMDKNIIVGLPKDKELKKLIRDYHVYEILRDDCQNTYEHYRDYKDDPNFEDPEAEKEYEELFNHMKMNTHDEFFYDFKTIKLTGTSEQLLEYVKKNVEYLYGKTIYINSQYGISSDEYERCKNDLTEIKKYLPTSTFKVYITGNTEPTTVLEYKSVVEKIENFVDYIKELNVSPLEQIMLVYDKIKYRIYKHEGEDEAKSTSRDLSKVLLGDEIVCVGFTAIFTVLIEKLGLWIKSSGLEAKQKEDAGHVRSIIFVDDSKYKVKGFYYFDPTWDSRLGEDDSKYLNRYKCFARTSEEIKILDNHNELENNNYRFLDKSILTKLRNELPNVYTIMDYYKLGGKPLFNSFLSVYSEKIEINPISNDKQVLIDELEKLYILFNLQIDPTTMTELIYNVRKIEYINDPENTPFSIDDIKQSVISNKYQFISPSSYDKIACILKYGGDLKRYYQEEQESIFKSELDNNQERIKEIEEIKLSREKK